MKTHPPLKRLIWTQLSDKHFFLNTQTKSVYEIAKSLKTQNFPSGPNTSQMTSPASPNHNTDENLGHWRSTTASIVYVTTEPWMLLRCYPLCDVTCKLRWFNTFKTNRVRILILAAVLERNLLRSDFGLFSEKWTALSCDMLGLVGNKVSIQNTRERGTFELFWPYLNEFGRDFWLFRVVIFETETLTFTF